MDTQSLLQNEGAPYTIEWESPSKIKYVFKLRYATQQMRADFEQEAKKREIKLRLDTMEGQAPEVIDRTLDRLYEQFDSKDKEVNMSFEGTKCQRLLSTPEGWAMFVRIQLGKEAKKLTDDEYGQLLIDKQDEIIAYLKEYERKIESLKKELNWDVINNPKGEGLDPKVVRAAAEKYKLL